jgi:hypothetical protein
MNIKDCPIGLLSKNYDTIIETLNRNIGSGQHTYDGFGDTIGKTVSLYQSEKVLPWFLSNPAKKSYANYLDYINGVYGIANTFEKSQERTLSFNILGKDIDISLGRYDDYALTLNDKGLNIIEDYNIINAFNGALEENKYSNSKDDTELGKANNKYLSRTLFRSAYFNSERGSGGKNITSTLPLSFGLNLDTINDTSYRFKINEQTGFVDDTAIMDPSFSPVYGGWPLVNENGLYLDRNNNSNGVYANLGAYQPYFDVLSDKTKDILTSTLQRNKYGYEITGQDLNVAANVYTKGTNVTFLNNVEFFYTENVSPEQIARGEYNPSTKKIEPLFIEQPNKGAMTSYSNLFVDNATDVKDLIAKTNKGFQNSKINNYKTIISSFHTQQEESSLTGTALTKQYGFSHGRNLLAKESARYNGYDDPYCRTWTWHHQYNQYIDAIRPFTNGGRMYDIDDELGKQEGWDSFRRPADSNSAFTFDKGGSNTLKNFGSIDYTNNGLVIISPTNEAHELKDIRRSMFSIENLAWKDIDPDNYRTISKDQIGPNGGRIMWFPPYNIKFNENVGVNWNETNFIGRAEPIYTYTNTNRTGTLSFTILIDHPSVINYWEDRGKESTGEEGKTYEDSLLRFFAGCEVLRATQPRGNDEKNGTGATTANADGGDDKTNPKTDKDGNKALPTGSDVPEATSDEAKLTFFVFYPNNYSGVDDKLGVVDPMAYLLNGTIAQKDANGQDIPTVNNIVGDGFTAHTNVTYYSGYELYGSSGLGISEGITTSGGTATVTYNGNDSRTFYPYTGSTGKIWYYRVDKRYEQQILRPENYFDNKDYGLNGNIGRNSVMNFFGGVKADELVSLADIYCAFNEDFRNGLNTSVYNQENVDKINSYIKNYDITYIQIEGGASHHGYEKKNEDELAPNRAKSVERFFNRNIPSVTKTISTFPIDNDKYPNDVNAIEAKLTRCAKVTMHFKMSKKSVLNEEMIGTGNTYTSGNPMKPKDEYTTDRVVTASTQPSEPETYTRYDGESRFFDRIKLEDPVSFSKITQKIKYFNPAFHSITPEGFNGRLTFLHQCTRQGPTLGDSDFNRMSANNLAFGRSPVIVVRVGDWYNTKAIIESMQIDYGDQQWDLNIEGIGSMPMLANVTLSLKFIGGQSMTGPIERLQNATSFNYYANTEIYDDRSEISQTDEKGNVLRFKPFNPKVK